MPCKIHVKYCCQSFISSLILFQINCYLPYSESLIAKRKIVYNKISEYRNRYITFYNQINAIKYPITVNRKQKDYKNPQS